MIMPLNPQHLYAIDNGIQPIHSLRKDNSVEDDDAYYRLASQSLTLEKDEIYHGNKQSGHYPWYKPSHPPYISP